MAGQLFRANSNANLKVALLSGNRRSISVERLFNTSSALLKHPACEPVKPKPCVPLCQVKKPPKPPCETPKQPLWQECKRICLPCCDKISLPCSCDKLDIKLNHCKKEEYRLPSFTECNKVHIRRGRKKECCYHCPVCYIKPLKVSEVKPLLRIKDRQALVLGRARH